MMVLKNILAAATLTAACAPVVAQADIAISTDPTQNMTCASGVCTPTAKKAVLNVTDLTTMLGAGDTTIQAQFVKSGRPKNAGPIEMNAALSWTNSSKLTLSSDVHVNAPMTIMGTGSLTISKSLMLQAGSGVTFWDLSSGFSVAGTPYTLVGDVSTLAADIAAAKGNGSYALANDYDAAGDTFRKAPIAQFAGQFTGLGHSIANLKITNGSKDCEGFVAENRGTLKDVWLKAMTVTSVTQKNVGGMAGCNYGLIFNASVDGSISGSSSANVGGIVGANMTNNGVQFVRVTASISGGQAGGVAGDNEGSLYEAYANGSVAGQSNVGGLAGANRNDIQDSYSTAAVNGNGGTVGGLAGFNNGTIADSYSIGAVTGTGVVGGLVGYDPNESVINGYWDLDTSGVSDPNRGAGFPQDDTSITGLTSAQLQSKLPPGFDRKTWHIDPSINGGFPYLVAIPPQ